MNFKQPHRFVNVGCLIDLEVKTIHRRETTFISLILHTDRQIFCLFFAQ